MIFTNDTDHAGRCKLSDWSKRKLQSVVEDYVAGSGNNQLNSTD